jgi:superfamily I DNA and/or RNA helicase
VSDFPTIKGLEISVDAEPVIYYANALNGAPAIRGIQIRYDGKEPLTDLKVELKVTSLGVDLSHVFNQKVVLLSKGDIHEVPVKVHWEASALWNLTEAQPADIEIRIYYSGTLIHQAVQAIQVASPAHWQSSTMSSAQTLAAFVQPNHPAVNAVIKKAAEILKSRGKEPSFSGYQALPRVEPILDMVEALWDAVKSMKINYSDPPASWDLPGQKIRNAQRITEDKVATCLDSTLFFASILENVGLSPVVSLAPGHAWVGFWMIDPDRYEMPIKQVVVATREAVTYADLDKPALVFLESTLLCETSNPSDFASARKRGFENITRSGTVGEASGYSAVIDILLARRNTSQKVIPMPASVVTATGAVEVYEYKPAEFTYNMLLDQLSVELKDKGKSANLLDTQLPPRLRKWLDSLLDLSLRNPLINFRSRSSSLPLVMQKGTVAQLEDMLTAGAAFEVVSFGDDEKGNALDFGDDRGQDTGLPDEARDMIAKAFKAKKVLTRYSIKESTTRLRRMASNAKSLIEETGSNGLYIALGELVWIPEGKLEVRSPLLLVPVTLTPRNRSREFYLTIDESSSITPNFSLVQKFKVDLNIDLDMLTNLATDDSGIDVPGTFEAVRQKLVESHLNGFRVDETATLGFFNFSSYRLWRDLIDNWKIFEKNPLVKHLIYTPNVPFEDPNAHVEPGDLDALVAKLPIEADSSQALAVAEALNGKTFVLQGPPGTGKSQTITNLLARSLHEGKRVLFVAEKKDALDVVKERLEKVGLGDFSLDLHDKAMSPKFVKQQLLNALNKNVRADLVGYKAGLDSYEQSVRPMVDYRARLHEVSEFGESLYSAMDKYLLAQGDQELPIGGEFLAASNESVRTEALEAIKTLGRLGSATGTLGDSEWFVTNLSAQSTELQTNLTAVLNELNDSMIKVVADDLALRFVKSATSVEALESARVLNVTGIPEGDLSVLANPANSAARETAIKSLTDLANKVHIVPYDLTKIKQFDSNIELGNVAEARASGFMSRGGKLKAIVKRVNAIMGAEVIRTPDELELILTGFRDIVKAEEIAVLDLDRIPGYRFNPRQNLMAMNDIRKATEELEALEALSDFLKYQGEGSSIASELLKAAGENQSRFDSLIAFSASVGKLFGILATTPESIELWKRGAGFGDRLIESLPVWIEDARQHNLVQFGRFVDLNAVFSQLRAAGLTDAVNEIISGKVSYQDAVNAFNKGYYKALFNNLMVRQGFNTFDGGANSNYLGKLADSKENLQDIMPAVLGAELASRRGFDPNIKVGAVGDLILALNAKRSPAIRTLLRKHWDVITKISPCVLASPDSTVRFIDADLRAFDLVVFDEASQIKVANSIGALGRGKASIVVGDSKQMPPTSVAQSRTGVEDEEAEEDEELYGTDAESILDMCANARVPDVYLNWHYRSEDESLIAFSNQKYYEARLNSFPNPAAERETKGLRFEYVEGGHFVRKGEKGESPLGTNHKEAVAIVAEIARRAKDPELRNDSVGIVTFNQQQQAYIYDMLVTSTNKDIQDVLEKGLGGEEILIKNLETVQGSERDVILFSVAFSRKPGGKELPLNFGPLNNAGGERRLNVAVTRAKRQVIVFCSFPAAELKARKPDSVGLADLAEFLVIASNPESTQVLNVTSELDNDRHRTRVLTALREAGLKAVEDMGLSGFKVDIAVYDPKNTSKAILGILLDGPRWNSRNTVNDRDLLPVNVLEKKMGWPLVERIWMPSWIRDEAGEIERIKEAFAKAKLEAKKPRKREVKPDLVKQREAAEENAPEVEEASKSAKSTGGNGGRARTRDVLPDLEEGDDPVIAFIQTLQHFTPAEQTRAGLQTDLDYLFDRKVVEAIRKLVDKVTANEGPCHPSRIASYIGGAFGYERVVAKRVREIIAVKFPGHDTDAEGFIYPLGKDAKTYKEFAISPDGIYRHHETISLVEIANFMKAFCAFTHGFQPESLVKNASLAFGFKSMSKSIQERFSEALQFGLATGRLTQRDDYILAGN